MTPTHHYFSYLLRLWKTASETDPSWRISLEEPHTGRQFTFTSLEHLSAFLRDQCSQDENGESNRNRSMEG